MSTNVLTFGFPGCGGYPRVEEEFCFGLIYGFPLSWLKFETVRKKIDKVSRRDLGNYGDDQTRNTVGIICSAARRREIPWSFAV